MSESARIVFSDGREDTFKDQSLAYRVWLALPRGTRAAFRAAGDRRPIVPWDFVDKPFP
ncbi:hypothetical protein LCGC14_1540470 [marine sediment metagenome]|uniref:Uncharacterized protein n=1 Tax=marine sediment metagenome TaxID=412755 RepID=A0A0F9JE46_9ZZZZ